MMLFMPRYEAGIARAGGKTYNKKTGRDFHPPGSLAKQLGKKGIRVNGVAPGPIWTPLQVSGGATQEHLNEFGGKTALGRPGQPVELASTYVRLAAADASYAAGQVYGSSGGGGQP
jgi:NAD(P)-dependent dehydrogenase (short-subunit alcohol dehydrogenase family)